LTYIKNELHLDTLTQPQIKFRNYGLEVTIDSIKSSAPRFSTAIVIGLYRPPNASKEWFNHFMDLIKELAPCGNLILLGDLNCNLLTPNCANTKKLNNVLELGQIKIPNIFPTRIAQHSASCIDIIGISHNYYCNTYRSGELAVSDHLPVEAEIEFAYRSNVLVPTYSRNFNNIDYPKLNAELSMITLPSADGENVDSLLQYWMNETEQLLDKYAPLKARPTRKTKSLNLPPDIIEMIHMRNIIVRKIKADPFNEGLLTDLKITQRKVKSHISKFKKTQGENALNNNDPKGAWKFIKQVTNQTTVITKPPVPLQELNEYFVNATITQSPDDGSIILPSCSVREGFSFHDIPMHTVSQHLLNIKQNTSTGPDNLPARFLKNSATALRLT
jgi:hypothetical protein